MLGIYELIRSSTEFNSFNTIQDAVFDSLKKAILCRQLPVGERLIEKHLAEIYCVSRTPIRQALKKLSDEGLVEYAERQGAVVSHINSKDVIEVFQLREVFENLLIESAVKNMNQKYLDRIYQEISYSEKLYDMGEIGGIKKSFKNLQKSIIELADMPRTAMMLVQLEDYMNQFRLVSLEHPSRCVKAIQEHHRIVHAMGKMKVQEAQHQNKLHLMNAKEIMICTFENKH